MGRSKVSRLTGEPIPRCGIEDCSKTVYAEGLCLSHFKNKPKRARVERSGCVQLRRSRKTGTLVGIYRASEAGLDDEGGAWVTVCEDHGTLCNHETRKLAEWHAPSVDWCEDCSTQ